MKDYVYVIILVIILVLIIGIILMSNKKTENYISKLTYENCPMDVWQKKINEFASKGYKGDTNQINLRECEYTEEPRKSAAMTWGVELQKEAGKLGIPTQQINSMATDICGIKKMTLFKNIKNENLGKFVDEYNINLSVSEKCKSIPGIQDKNNKDARKNCFNLFETEDDFFARDYDKDILKGRMEKVNAMSNNREENVVISPADCYCMLFTNVDKAKEIWIKGKNFTVDKMIGEGGEKENNIIICRLAPGHYHKFHVPIEGKVVKMRLLGNEFLSVQPKIVNSPTSDVFTENKRVVLSIQSEKFGLIKMIIVGASCVGSISFDEQNYPLLSESYSKLVKNVKSKGSNFIDIPNIHLNLGNLLGSFHYGGSTIILVIPKLNGNVFLNEYILNASEKGIETEIPALEPLMFY